MRESKMGARLSAGMPRQVQLVVRFAPGWPKPWLAFALHQGRHNSRVLAYASGENRESAIVAVARKLPEVRP